MKEPAVAVKLPDIVLFLMVIEAGTARALLLLESETVAPLAGAAVARKTVQLVLVFGANDELVHWTDEMVPAAGSSVNVTA